MPDRAASGGGEDGLCACEKKDRRADLSRIGTWRRNGLGHAHRRQPGTWGDRCRHVQVRGSRRSRVGLAHVRSGADTALIDKRASFINAMDPDLSAFKDRGGKLLIYHGWNDGGSGGAISPQNSVNYYSSVLAKMGPRQGNWLRLFMVPGMAHCGGGPGPNQFDCLAAMERWRESGTPPDQIIAAQVTDFRVDMTRPLCPYPQVAQYKGVGTTNDAANFVCKAP